MAAPDIEGSNSDEESVIECASTDEDRVSDSAAEDAFRHKQPEEPTVPSHPSCNARDDGSPAHNEDIMLLQQRILEDPPEMLAQYRREYLEIYSRLDPGKATITAQSHICVMLETAINQLSSCTRILQKLTGYMFSLEAAGEGEELSCYSLYLAIGEGQWLSESDLVGEEKMSEKNSTEAESGE